MGRLICLGRERIWTFESEFEYSPLNIAVFLIEVNILLDWKICYLLVCRYIQSVTFSFLDHQMCPYIKYNFFVIKKVYWCTPQCILAVDNNLVFLRNKSSNKISCDRIKCFNTRRTSLIIFYRKVGSNWRPLNVKFVKTTNGFYFILYLICSTDLVEILSEFLMLAKNVTTSN